MIKSEKNFNIMYVILFVSVLAVIISIVAIVKSFEDKKPKGTPKPPEILPQHAFKNAFQQYIEDGNLQNDIKPLISQSCLSTVPQTQQCATREEIGNQIAEINSKCLTQDNAVETYLSKTDANDVYLTKTGASEEYVSIQNANEQIFNPENLGNIEGLTSTFYTRDSANAIFARKDDVNKDFYLKSDADNLTGRINTLEGDYNSYKSTVSENFDKFDQSIKSDYLLKTDAASNYISMSGPFVAEVNQKFKDYERDYVSNSNFNTYKDSVLQTYLTKTEGNGINDDLQSYKASVQQIYLPKTDASSTYLPISATDIYLSNDNASKTYLTIDNADKTYLSKTDASSTYLPISATDIYLSNDNASKTYLTIDNADKTYLSKTEATTKYVDQSAFDSYRTSADDKFFSKAQGSDILTQEINKESFPISTLYTKLQPSIDNLFLRKTDAANTYLTQVNATGAFNDIKSNYLLKSDAASTYITPALAASTYLTPALAASTYLTQLNATGAFNDIKSNYLSKTDANNIYLSKTGAASTYLTQAVAGNTYIPKSQLSTLVNTTDNYLIRNPLGGMPDFDTLRNSNGAKFEPYNTDNNFMKMRFQKI